MNNFEVAYTTPQQTINQEKMMIERNENARVKFFTDLLKI